MSKARTNPASPTGPAGAPAPVALRIEIPAVPPPPAAGPEPTIRDMDDAGLEALASADHAAPRREAAIRAATLSRELAAIAGATGSRLAELRAYGRLAMRTERTLGERSRAAAAEIARRRAERELMARAAAIDAARAKARPPAA